MEQRLLLLVQTHEVSIVEYLSIDQLPVSYIASQNNCESIIAATMLEAQPQSRHAFLASVAATLVIAPNAAMAAKYGSFGAGSPEVLDPADAEIDQGILKSSSVQDAIKKVQGYQNIVRDFKKTLEADPQANLQKRIIKELDFSVLRESLNTMNSAFEEDTQRGTDRLIRNILQDITELEQANKQKDGVPRSQRRLDIMKAKLDKLEQAFSDYLAFTK